MPRAKQRETSRLWADALANVLAEVRAHAGLAPDAIIPDMVLLREAEKQFEPVDLWPPQQWFVRRLAGAADTANLRQVLLEELLAEAQGRNERGTNLSTFGLPHRRRTNQEPYRP